MRDGRLDGNRPGFACPKRSLTMPPILDLSVGILFFVCGLIFLTTRRSYEAAIARNLEHGWLTPQRAEAKRRARVWIGVCGLVCDCGLTVGYFLNP